MEDKDIKSQAGNVQDTVPNGISDVINDDVVKGKNVKNGCFENKAGEISKESELGTEDKNRDSLFSEKFSEKDLVKQDMSQNDLVTVDVGRKDIKDDRRINLVTKSKGQKDSVTKNKDQKNLVIENKNQKDFVIENTDQKDLVKENTDQKDSVTKNKDWKKIVTKNKDWKKIVTENKDQKDLVTKVTGDKGQNELGIEDMEQDTEISDKVVNILQKDKVNDGSRNRTIGQDDLSNDFGVENIDDQSPKRQVSEDTQINLRNSEDVYGEGTNSVALQSTTSLSQYVTMAPSVRSNRIADESSRNTGRHSMKKLALLVITFVLAVLFVVGSVANAINEIVSPTKFRNKPTASTKNMTVK